jgi:hypothetical protein
MVKSYLWSSLCNMFIEMLTALIVCVIHCYLCMCNWIELYGKLSGEFMHVDQHHNYTYLTQSNSLRRNYYKYNDFTLCFLVYNPFNIFQKILFGNYPIFLLFRPIKTVTHNIRVQWITYSSECFAFLYMFLFRLCRSYHTIGCGIGSIWLFVIAYMVCPHIVLIFLCFVISIM